MTGMISVDSERGQELGFTSDKFSADSYLWDKPDAVVISLIFSHYRGNFRSLVEAIHAENKRVIVPTPLGRMAKIVRKCGYAQTVSDDGCELWILEPPKKGADQ